MSKPNNGVFWFEAITRTDTSGIRDAVWMYCVGIDDTTPVALVTGPDDYTACARARVICAALNDERRKALAASQEDE